MFADLLLQEVLPNSLCFLSQFSELNLYFLVKDVTYKNLRGAPLGKQGTIGGGASSGPGFDPESSSH